MEETRNITNANQARIFANVGRLLDEQKQAVDEGHLETIQKHASEVSELQEKPEESQNPASSLVEVARLAGVVAVRMQQERGVVSAGWGAEFSR